MLLKGTVNTVVHNMMSGMRNLQETLKLPKKLPYVSAYKLYFHKLSVKTDLSPSYTALDRCGKKDIFLQPQTSVYNFMSKDHFNAEQTGVWKRIK